MNRKITKVLICLSWSVFFVDCRGCGSQPEAMDILDLVDTHATAVVHIPKLNELLQATGGFIQALTSKAGRKIVQRMRASIEKQYGFDLFEPSTFRKIGLEPAGSVLVFTEGIHPEPILTLTIKNQSDFSKQLKTIIEKTDGANQYEQENVQGFKVYSAGRPFGNEVVPAFYWAYVGHYALIVRAAGQTSLHTALTRIRKQRTTPEMTTLRTFPPFQKLVKRVTPGQIVIWADAQSSAPALQEEKEQEQSLRSLTSIDLAKTGISLDMLIETEIKKLAQIEQRPAPWPLLSLIDADATFLFVSSVFHPNIIQIFKQHPVFEQKRSELNARFLKESGLDFDQDILPLLAGDVTLAVYLRPLDQLAKKLKKKRSLKALLDTFDIAMCVKINDHQKMQAVLKKGVERLKKRGIAIRSRKVEWAKQRIQVFEPDREAPKLGWALTSTHYIYSAGQGRLEKFLARLAEPSDALAHMLDASPFQKLAKRTGASVALLRMGKVAEAGAGMRAGQQPQKMGMDAIVASGLEIIKTIGNIAIGVYTEDDVIRLQVRESIQ